MKLPAKVFVYLIFLIVFQTAAAAQDAVTISPAKPTAGDRLIVTYHTDAPGAAITDPDSLNLVFGYSTFYKQPDELSMNQEGTAWSVSWDVPDYAKFASFYFKDGNLADKGPGGHYYEIFVYEDDKVVEGAYKRKIFSLRERYENQKKADSVRAELYQKQLADKPEDFLVRLKLLKTKMSLHESRADQLEKDAYKLITEKLQQSPSSETLQKVVTAYRIMGDKAKSDSVKKIVTKEYPTSPLAIRTLYSKAREMDNPDEKLKALQKVIQNTENDRYRTQSYEEIFYLYQEEGNVQRMAWYAEQVEESPWPWKARQLNGLANAFIEQGDSLELALDYAKKASRAVPEEMVGPVRITDEGQFISSYVEDTVATRKRDEIKSDILATFGLIHIKRKQYDTAGGYLKKAMQLEETEAAKQNLAQLYMKTNRPEKAFDIYWDLLMEEPVNKDYKKKLKQAYIDFNGSEKGFKNETAKLDERWKKEMVRKYNDERLDKEAPSLSSITDLEGHSLDPTSLENKVVVIDLWATWCGPCLSAFPYLQKVYEKYEDNPEVKFIVLNSGWGNTIKDARKWKKKVDYTFPLYYDEGSEVTEAFGVRGIPTTFILGEGGNIQFKKTGFRGPTMERKLKLKIEMLLDEEKYFEETSSGK